MAAHRNRKTREVTPARQAAASRSRRVDAREAFEVFEAMGHYDPDTRLVQTLKWFAKKWGVQPATLSRWRAEPTFEARVERARNRLMGERERQIWGRVADEILVSGSASDAMLFSKRFGFYKEATPAPGGAMPAMFQLNVNLTPEQFAAEQAKLFAKLTGAPSIETALRDPDADPKSGS